MYAKFTHTFSASGLSALLHLVVSRLNKSELTISNKDLKQSKGNFILEIEGFSMCSDTNLLNNVSECTIFMRSSKKSKCLVGKECCN